MKVHALLLILASAAVHPLHLALDRAALREPNDPRETLPSPEALRFLSLSYKSLVADYYWMRAISHFGTTEMHEVLYPNLEPFLRRVVALDPYFSHAYFMAGTALTLEGMDLTASLELLEVGMRYRGNLDDDIPDDWRIPFLLGFNAYFFAHDYARATRALALAARLPGAPEVAGPLATRIAAEAGEPEIGLHFIDTILDSVTDDTVRQTYLERRTLLLLELRLKILNQAAQEYVARTGQAPAALQDLVRAGILKSLPEEPLGGRFFLVEGVVRTSSDARRLRLPAQAKGVAP